jgi:hypothetical protein
MPQLAKIPPASQITPVDLVAPGFRGLNFVQSGSLLNPAYATQARNAILDANGRLAARDGVSDVTTTPVAETIRTLFEAIKEDGSTEVIFSYPGGISNNLADPAAGDISGAVDDTDGQFWFQNFNDKTLAFREGQKLSVRTTGNFAAVTESSGTAPTGGIGLAAFGRVWQTANKQTIKYSGLLDETDWGGAGAGTIDMSTIWTQGTDEVTAIAAFNGSLVVFGKKHIVFWIDGQGSALGLDPNNMYVVDTIAGTGTLSQHTLQAVGETDLLFLSKHGVQSIKRLIQEKSAPIANLTKYVRDELLFQLQSETVANIRSAYNPLTGFYLLSFPVAGKTWVLDQRRRYRDDDGEEASVITDWDIAPTALVSTDTNVLYLSIEAGYVSRYLGDTDRGETFRFIYQSPWLDLGEDFANRLKILKRLGSILFVRNETNIVFKWNVDFDDGFKSISRTVEGDASAEWGSAEWGAAEWSGGLALRILKVPARGRGQYYRIGIEADVNGEFAVQQAELFTKLGRLA